MADLTWTPQKPQSFLPFGSTDCWQAASKPEQYFFLRSATIRALTLSDDAGIFLEEDQRNWHGHQTLSFTGTLRISDCNNIFVHPPDSQRIYLSTDKGRPGSIAADRPSE